MKLYNTYNQKLKKLDLSQKIGIYVCGITPYDTTHIGHAFTFIIYDVLVRYLRFLGAKVTYVQNITDIDDDILIKAKSLHTSWKRLGDDETVKHFKNLEALNFLKPDYFPKATDNITPMIQIIGVLIKKKLAYIRNGNVYFEIKKDKNFGKLSKYGYPAMLEIANDRGNFPLDPNKKDPLDFVLWQKNCPKDDQPLAEEEPSWDSPWGKGRPGWHIECSAMSMHFLGPTITIHGGGTDLIFPHHEAEIAQSENTTGKKFVKIWMHASMVYCDGKKMSKSLGNMIFLHDLLKKYNPNVIRIFLLMHHYRKPWNYDEKEFVKAKTVVKILEDNSQKARLPLGQVKKLIPVFFKPLDDDLNTPKAIEILVNFAKKAKNKQTKKIVYTCSQILGLKF